MFVVAYSFVGSSHCKCTELGHWPHFSSEKVFDVSEASFTAEVSFQRIYVVSMLLLLVYKLNQIVTEQDMARKE